MNDRVVVVGGRKKADFLAESLTKRKMNVIIINDTNSFCVDMSHKYPNAIVACGDGTKPYLYDDLDIEDSDIFIAMMPSDADNLIACQLATKQYHVKKVFCTVSNPKNVEIFKQLGINNVISSTYIVSKMIEQMATLRKIENYIPLEQGTIGLIEIIIEPNMEAVNKRIIDLKVPRKSIIATIIRNQKAIIPRGDTMIEAYDKLIVLAEDQEKELMIKHLTKVVS